MSWIRVAGQDPSLRNWGWSQGWLELDTGEVIIEKVGVINAKPLLGKQVRQNSKDLSASQQIYAGAIAAAQGAQAIFVEVPVGSQSSRAMASYGICVGVLGALRAQGIPFFEVTPTEVKLITGHGKQATKRQMIQWAYDQHHTANWPFQTQKGKTSIVESKAEHMADACAAIHAGIAGNEFQQMRTFLHAPHPNQMREILHANHAPAAAHRNGH